MKKKIIALCLIVALAITAITGATLAYFTDTDNKTNTFTVGNVAIDLIEQERQTKTEDGETKTILGNFTQEKTLYPIVGSAQGTKDEFGLPTAENYVDKVVTVKNTGTEAAYIRAYFAIPSALDDGYETFNAGRNTLHFNFGTKMVDGTPVSTDGNEWQWKQANGKWNYFETTIDGIAYNVYFADYYTTVAAGATTERLINGVYLDKTFDCTDGKYYAFGSELTLDKDWNWSNVSCPVFAVAVQAAGFDNAAEAVTEAFGAQYNPWGGTVTNWQ